MHIENIGNYLKENGIKPSIQRIKIFQYLMDNHTHPTVDDIFVAKYKSIVNRVKDTLNEDDVSVLEEHLQIGNFGGFPSITIPNGFVDGLPVGVNITGNCYKDQEVLNMAFALEGTLPYKNQIAKECE